MDTKNTEALKWAENYLVENGYVLISSSEIVRDTPWSKVIRFSTSKGSVYFKQMALPFSIEAVLLQFLFENVSTSVPEVIASHHGLSCFLMKDAGTPLRDYLKTHYSSDLLCRALKAYAHIQHLSIQHLDELFSMGMQDWRLKKLPELYVKLIAQKGLLISDGLTLAEIEMLHNLSPRLSALCEQLSDYGIPETIEHVDFHDNNILFKDNNLTVNDWGDAVITHPFFSLASCLNSAVKNNLFNRTHERYLAAKNAYIDTWLKYASKDKLLEAFELSEKLRYVQFSLSFSRVNLCPGIEKLVVFK